MGNRLETPASIASPPELLFRTEPILDNQSWNPLKVSKLIGDAHCTHRNGLCRDHGIRAPNLSASLTEILLNEGFTSAV